MILQVSNNEWSWTVLKDQSASDQSYSTWEGVISIPDTSIAYRSLVLTVSAIWPNHWSDIMNFAEFVMYARVSLIQLVIFS